MRDNFGDHGPSQPAKAEEPLAAFFDGMTDRAKNPKAIAADAAIGAGLGLAKLELLSGGREFLAPMISKAAPWIIGATILEEGLRRSANDHTSAGKARAFGEATFDVGVGAVAQGASFVAAYVWRNTVKFGVDRSALYSVPRGLPELDGLANDSARPDLLKDIRSASATSRIPGEGAAFGPTGPKVKDSLFDRVPDLNPRSGAGPALPRIFKSELPPVKPLDREIALAPLG